MKSDQDSGPAARPNGSKTESEHESYFGAAGGAPSAPPSDSRNAQSPIHVWETGDPGASMIPSAPVRRLRIGIPGIDNAGIPRERCVWGGGGGGPPAPLPPKNKRGSPCVF